jgi:hypothetical protein
LNDAGELRSSNPATELRAKKPVSPQAVWFNSGVEEMFAVSVLPGYRNPALVGPETELDDFPSVWIPPSAHAIWSVAEQKDAPQVGRKSAPTHCRKRSLSELRYQ